MKLEEGVSGQTLTRPDALLQPDVAIQPLVEDWVHTYQGAAGDADAEKAAVQELVLLFIRASGFGADVDEDEAMDQDGVVDVIERIQDESVNVSNLSIRTLIRARPIPRRTPSSRVSSRSDRSRPTCRPSSRT